MCVLMTVSAESLQAWDDLRALDGTKLASHLWMLCGVLASNGASCTRKELALGARCAAKMLLQTTARHVEVRMPPYTLLVYQGAAFARAGSSLMHAVGPVLKCRAGTQDDAVQGQLPTQVTC